MNLELFEKIQDLHVKGWNEKDSVKRLELLKQIYAEDIKMYDNNFILQNLTEVSNFIGKLLSEDPLFNFSVVKPIEPLQNGARVYGRIRTTEVTLDSMDFFIIADGKVQHLYAFMEPAT
jgi:hypothetical protein